MSIYLEFPSIADYPVYNPIENLLIRFQVLTQSISEAEKADQQQNMPMGIEKT